MTFEELLKQRRSIRDFQSRSVPLPLVKTLIKQATLAPSAGNDQPWRFVIVQNKTLIKRMSDESKANVLHRIAANPDDYATRFEKYLQDPSYNVFFNAPCLVLIIGFSRLKNMYVDCALAASYFMLAATNRGLGTCWVNLGAEIKSPELLQVLGVPDDGKIVAPIVLGYPARTPKPPKRKKPNIINILS